MVVRLQGVHSYRFDTESQSDPRTGDRHTKVEVAMALGNLEPETKRLGLQNCSALCTKPRVFPGYLSVGEIGCKLLRGAKPRWPAIHFYRSRKYGIMNNALNCVLHKLSSTLSCHVCSTSGISPGQNGVTAFWDPRRFVPIKNYNCFPPGFTSVRASSLMTQKNYSLTDLTVGLINSLSAELHSMCGSEEILSPKWRSPHILAIQNKYFW